LAEKLATDSQEEKQQQGADQQADPGGGDFGVADFPFGLGFAFRYGEFVGHGIRK
jgi:hypothetical protein